MRTKPSRSRSDLRSEAGGMDGVMVGGFEPFLMVSADDWLVSGVLVVLWSRMDYIEFVPWSGRALLYSCFT